MGQVLDGRPGPGADPPGRRQGRHPDERARRSTSTRSACPGLNTIYLANQMIAAGEADIVVAGGMESMTNAPYLAAGARAGFRYGNTELRDAIIADGLWCSFDACLMGLGTERYAGGESITREQQDDIAVQSNERAANAIKDGRLADEIVPVSIPQRKGEPILVETDEGVRPGTTMESLAGLQPAFDKDGTITAGQRLADQRRRLGAVVMMSEKAAERPRRRRRSASSCRYGMVAGPDSASLLHQPSRAILQGRSSAPASRRGRRRPVRDQRGLRRRRHRVDGRTRHQRRDRQRQRWGDRPRPPDRHERQPPGAHPAARAAPPRWRPRRRRACAAAAARATPPSCAPSERDWPAAAIARCPSRGLRVGTVAGEPSSDDSRLGLRPPVAVSTLRA